MQGGDTPLFSRSQNNQNKPADGNQGAFSDQQQQSPLFGPPPETTVHQSMPIASQAPRAYSPQLGAIVQQFVDADYLTAAYDTSAPGMAELYDAITLPQWSEHFGHILMSQLLVANRSPHPQVLDVACGTGYPTIEIARYLGKDADVVGIDPWHEAIMLAKHKAQDQWLQTVAFLQEDISHTTLPENQFDIITCNLGYPSFADRGRSMAMIARLARQNGILLMTIPLQTAFREFLDIYHAVLAELQLTTYMDALVALVKGKPTIATLRSSFSRSGLMIEQEITDTFTLSFTDARDFLTSPIVAFSYMVGWRTIIPDLGLRKVIFHEIERRLNAIAVESRGLHFSIPVLCMVARKG